MMDDLSFMFMAASWLLLLTVSNVFAWRRVSDRLDRLVAALGQSDSQSGHSGNNQEDTKDLDSRVRGGSLQDCGNGNAADGKEDNR